MDSASVLQHPRRNLGSRHRSQADRFVKLAKQDPSRESENLAWAEQNAQQALAVADKGYVLVTGENKFTDSGNALLSNPEVRRSFLGG